MIETLEIDPRIKVREPKDLIATPKVVRVNAFDEDPVKTLTAHLSAAHQTGQPVVPVVIDSYGGDPYSLFAMIDVLRSSKVPVATVVEGKAMSAAAVLFSCGKKGLRYVGPNATLMIHDVSDESRRKKTEEMKADVKEADRVNKRLYQILDENTGRPRGWHWKQVQARGRADWYLDARSAMRLGYADHVRIPRVRTRVEVFMDFDE